MISLNLLQKARHVYIVKMYLRRLIKVTPSLRSLITVLRGNLKTMINLFFFL